MALIALGCGHRPAQLRIPQACEIIEGAGGAVQDAPPADGEAEKVYGKMPSLVWRMCVEEVGPGAWSPELPCLQSAPPPVGLPGISEQP